MLLGRQDVVEGAFEELLRRYKADYIDRAPLSSAIPVRGEMTQVDLTNKPARQSSQRRAKKKKSRR